MVESHFIWPKSSILRALISAPLCVSVTAVEQELRDMFQTGHPVLCSSGRVALALALIDSGVSRSEFVGVFPYASHCVLDAVSRIATPMTGSMAITAPLRIVYHQWSFVQEMNLPANTIEDCVDTLCAPGTKLFPGGGRFEIWSLPKILGTSSGGILWCRDEGTAERLRILRNHRGGGLLQWAIRLLAQKSHRASLYWQGAEADLGQVSRFQTAEIMAAVQSWEAIITNRSKKLSMVWPHAVEWLQVPVDRLPPVVPLTAVLDEKLALGLGILSGNRMIERFKSSGLRNLEKVLPIPIHQDVTELWVARVVKQIIYEKSRLSDE